MKLTRRGRWAVAGLPVYAVVAIVALSSLPGGTHSVDAAHATAAPSLPALPPELPDTPPPLPTIVAIPTLDVHAHVQPVAVGADGALGVPDDVQAVGVWRKDATTVLDAHVDSRAQGLGVFAHLGQLKPGDAIQVDADTFTVYAITQQPKDELPDTPAFTAPGVTLISCGGQFNYQTRHYADNIVVYAR